MKVSWIGRHSFSLTVRYNQRLQWKIYFIVKQVIPLKTVSFWDTIQDYLFLV